MIRVLARATGTARHGRRPGDRSGRRGADAQRSQGIENMHRRKTGALIECSVRARGAGGRRHRRAGACTRCRPSAPRSGSPSRSRTTSSTSRAMPRCWASRPARMRRTRKPTYPEHRGPAGGTAPGRRAARLRRYRRPRPARRAGAALAQLADFVVQPRQLRRAPAHALSARLRARVYTCAAMTVALDNYPLLAAIASPGGPAPPRRGQAAGAGARAARLPDPERQHPRRPFRRRARHGRAHDRPALRLRHPARPTGLGRGPSGLSAQGAHRAARPAAHHQAGRRARTLPEPRRERVRHLRRRTLEHLDQRRARHGGGRGAHAARTGAWSPSSATARSPPAWPSRRSITPARCRPTCWSFSTTTTCRSRRTSARSPITSRARSPGACTRTCARAARRCCGRCPRCGSWRAAPRST